MVCDPELHCTAQSIQYSGNSPTMAGGRLALCHMLNIYLFSCVMLDLLLIRFSHSCDVFHLLCIYTYMHELI